MEQIRGRVLKDDQVIIDGVDVWLDVTPTGKSYRWDGYFDLDVIPPGFSPITPSRYRLVLDDGRSGDFFLTKGPVVSSDQEMTKVYFQGTGNLQCARDCLGPE